MKILSTIFHYFPLIFFFFLLNASFCDGAELVINTEFIYGTVNGIEAKMEADTGSSSTFSTEELVRKYCGSAFEEGIEMDGNIIIESGCDNALVEREEVTVSVRLEVLTNWTGDYIVLGRDWMGAVGEVTFELGDTAPGGWYLSDVYRNGTFNGHDAKFLIDTGCSRGSALIRWDLVSKLCDGGFVKEWDETQFGGRNVTVYGHCWGTIELLDKTISQKFRVLEDIGREDVLLCTDVIEKLGSLTFRLPKSAPVDNGKRHSYHHRRHSSHKRKRKNYWRFWQ